MSVFYPEYSYRLDRLASSGRSLDLSEHQFIFNQAIQAHCRNFDWKDRAIRIVILGAVDSDGIGDLHHMLHVATLLQAAFPKATIVVGGEFRNLETRRFSIPLSPFEMLFWDSPSQLPSEMKAIFERLASTAHLLFEVSHISRLCDAELSRSPLRYTRITELSGRRQATHSYTMGVDLFGMGLAWKPDPDAATLSDLEDPFLKDLLLDQNPYFGYLHTQQLEFIALCLAHERNSPSQVVDIIIPSGERSFEGLSKHGKIKEILVIKRGVKVQHIEGPDPDGKTLRLIDPFPIAQKDLQRLINISRGAIGCTGDNSFVEVLSKKVPFYEIRSCKRDFFDSLIDLAKEHNQKPNSPLLQWLYFLLDCTLDPEEREVDFDQASDLLDNPEFHEELAAFTQFLKRHYDINPVITDLASHMLALQDHPSLIQFEDDLFRKYVTGQRSLEECAAFHKRAVSELLEGVPLTTLDRSDPQDETLALLGQIQWLLSSSSSSELEIAAAVDRLPLAVQWRIHELIYFSHREAKLEVDFFPYGQVVFDQAKQEGKLKPLLNLEAPSRLGHNLIGSMIYEWRLKTFDGQMIERFYTDLLDLRRQRVPQYDMAAYFARMPIDPSKKERIERLFPSTLPRDEFLNHPLAYTALYNILLHQMIEAAFTPQTGLFPVRKLEFQF